MSSGSVAPSYMPAYVILLANRHRQNSNTGIAALPIGTNREPTILF